MANSTFENYPLRMVAPTVLVQLAIYVLGGILVLRFGAAFPAVYAACILGLEYRVLQNSCRSCSYYGKTCCFGRGRLCTLVLGKGDPEKFAEREIGWTDVLPDFLVSTVPLLAGIILLVIRFDALLLAEVMALALLAFPATGFIRKAWACRFCRQREAGCPAEQLFARRKAGEARR
jgi:hypothetical protein